MTDLLTQSLAWVRSSHYLELTTRQLALLGLALAAGREGIPLHTRDAAAILNVSKPAISRAARGLEEFGLMQRSRWEKDGRDLLLTATDKAETLRLSIEGLTPIAPTLATLSRREPDGLAAGAILS